MLTTEQHQKITCQMDIVEKYQNEVIALRAQLAQKVVLPEPKEWRTTCDIEEKYQDGWNACLDEVQRLNGAKP